MKNLKKINLFAAFLIAIAGCNPAPEKKEPAKEQTTETKEAALPVLEYSVVANLPHDTSSFTEGLLIHNGKLVESTGSPSGSNFRSVLGTVDAKTGKIDIKAELDKDLYFGEGIVFFKNKIYQVTYKNQMGFMYDDKNYKTIGHFNYTGEGWGMTTDGNYIIMSDGTENLRYFDADFKPVKTLAVTESGYALDAINELEYINGYIYANIWMTGYIVKIDPITGKVVAKVNLTPLSYDMKNFHPNSMEMNGIAYDPDQDKIYVTGKAWPSLYEVKFAH